jgi:hypothetical protein
MIYYRNQIIYQDALNRKMLYRITKIYTILFLIGLVRRPYIKAQILSNKEAEKQIQ